MSPETNRVLRAKDRVNRMKIEIYTKDYCPFCTKAKDWLDNEGLDYTVHDLTDDTKRLAFYNHWNVTTMPQVFVDGKRIGGYSELVRDGREAIVKTQTCLDSSRVYKPFLYPDFVEIARTHEKMHWIEDEIDLSEDVADWKSNRLSQEEKDFIRKVLTLFTQSDVAVAETYVDHFLPRFKNNEIRMLLLSIANRESTHIRAYALLNETLGFSDSFYSEFLQYQEMADKADHMTAMDSSTHRGLALSLARSVFNEGVMLFASFAMLLNFARHNKMKGMCKVVDWSIKDEALHATSLAKLFRILCAEKTRIVNDDFKREIYGMARQTVDLEDAFIDLAFKHNEGAIQGLTPDEVKTYIRYITDQRLVSLGLKENYGVNNPLGWIDWVIGGERHGNFFESKISGYSVGGLTGKFDYEFLKG